MVGSALRGRKRVVAGVAYVLSHRLFAAVRIAALQCGKNFVMLAQGGLGATGPRAGFEAVEAKLVVDLVKQEPLDLWAPRRTCDHEMKILVW